MTNNYDSIIYPRPLFEGDSIAIVAPASIVRPEYIDGACERIRRMGFTPIPMGRAKGPAKGTYAASSMARLDDLKMALNWPEIRAVLCARGGYGAVHLMSNLSDAEIRRDPKWLIGFSDISALHARFLTAGVASIHGPMAKHFTESAEDDEPMARLKEIIMSRESVTYHVKASEGTLPGQGTGRLRGGNLAVLNGLAATPYDMLSIAPGEEVILFLEDIAEPMYKVERVLFRLWMSGTLDRVNGLIFGHFTDYKPDANYPNMEAMITHFLARRLRRRIPVVFGFPTGHTLENMPLIEGSLARLTAGAADVTLTMQQR